MPLAGPLADVVLTDQQVAGAQHELDLMTALIAELPGPAIQDQDQVIGHKSEANSHNLRASQPEPCAD
jgi:hypothetical protein